MTQSKSPMITASKSPLKDQPSSDETISDISIKFNKPKLGAGNIDDIEINRLSQPTPEAGTPNPTTPLQPTEKKNSGS